MEEIRELDHQTVKKLSKLLPSSQNVSEMCRKMAFGRFMSDAKYLGSEEKRCCCCQLFKTEGELKKHVSRCHSEEVVGFARNIEDLFYEHLKKEKAKTGNWTLEGDIVENFVCSCAKHFIVILYYLYTDIAAPSEEVSWQKATCRKLNFKGKIRVASEGINGTAEGCECAIGKYATEMITRFPQMDEKDFKRSQGDGAAFKDLRVSEYEELCSIGISTEQLKAVDGGRHLTPEEFHQEIEEKKDDTILLDCRNFYESKIGYFDGAVKPDLRKFSYFPTYVDKNANIFRNKRVLMYCTGGIRCERASAYIKTAGVCKEVLQLKGGIHK